MNDNENKIGEELFGEGSELTPESAKEEINQDIFSPITSRDVFSHTKDEDVSDEIYAPQETAQNEEPAEEAYEVYQGNPFDDFPKRDFTPANEPKAEQPAFNPYEAPKQSEYQPINQSAYQSPYRNTDTNNFNQSPYNNQGYNFNQPQYRGPDMTAPKKSKGKSVIIAVVAVCVIIAVGAIVTSLFGGNGGVSNQQTTAPTQGAADDITINAMQTTAPSKEISSVNSVFVADKVRPSVVGVMVYSGGQLAGEGSGILWGEDSTGTYTYVVTCAHVIDESNVTYGVLLLDGKTYEAEMVATDTRTDIGVLKIKATGLPLAEIGDSSTLKIGEPIYAIGNPGGAEYFGSITDGIVSAIDRSVSATYTMTCIQHNAAINPGNSGGALVNTAGQIVGINSSKIASTEYEGMGFAVPTSIAQSVVESLIRYQYVPNRPKLGIQYAEVSAYQLYSMVVSIKGLPQGSLVIAGISQDSSLANTKAEVGDLIIAVNGKDMDDSSVLLDLIDTGAVGDTLTLTLCRIEQRTYKTTTFDVTITLVEDKGDAQEEEPTTTAPSYNGDYYYGGAGSFEDFFNDYFGFGW
jgi:serine protease Do